MNFGYKMAAEAGCSSRAVIHRAAMTVTLLSSMALIYSGNVVQRPWLTLALALVNSSFFALGSLAKLSALKRAAAAWVFPVTKINAALVVVYALVLFGDRPRLPQWLGLLLTLSVLLIAGGEKKGQGNDRGAEPLGLLLALGSAVCTSLSMLAGKYAALSVEKFPYMALSYALVALHTGLAERYSGSGNEWRVPRTAWRYGVMIGLCNFAGYALVLEAFARGPLSLCQGVFANSFIVPVLLSAWFYQEKLTPRRLLGIALAITAVLLLKV